MNLIVMANQKLIIDTCTKKRERNPNITLKIIIISQGKREKKKGRKSNYKNNQKTITKMAISTYLSIITLNVCTWTKYSNKKI